MSSSQLFKFVEPPRKRIMMQLMVEKKDWVALENFVKGEDDIVKNAYYEWKSKQPMTFGSLPLTLPDNSCSTIQEPSYARHVSSQQSLGQTTAENMSMVPVTHQLAAIDMSSPLFDQLRETTTIVLLSETGTGKSTFVNALVNYLLYETMEEAQEKGVRILIRTCFTHTNENHEPERINIPPNLFSQNPSGNDIENENTEAGQSSTQFPKAYVFKFGPPGNEKKLCIIDTPGVGDVRGMEKEKENFHNTLAFLANYRNINAFCILLKPNQSTLTVGFRYCINEFLTALHVSAVNNIIFCLTNAKATSYKPGETLPTLKAELKALKNNRGITIPISRETVFCFENDCYRHLCSRKYGAYFDKEEDHLFHMSWEHSRKETYRLLEQVIKLKPHNMKDSLSINDVRSVILALARPMGEIARNQKCNEDLINERLKKVQQLQAEGASLKDQLYVVQLILKAEQAKYPITVCAAAKCVEHRSLDSLPGSKVQTIYKTECHKECYLKNVGKQVLENTALQKCWALHQDPEKCRNCGCSWKFHMHQSYRMVAKPEKVIDGKVQTSIDKNETDSKSLEIFINELRAKKDKLQKELNVISKASVEFAAFLRQYSITGYNNAYIDYLNLLIQEEGYKVGQGESNSVLEKLKQYKADYEQQIKLLDTHGKKSSCTKSLSQLYEMIETMRKLEFYGQVLKDVELLEMNSTNYKDDATSVKVNAIPKLLSKSWKEDKRKIRG